MAIAFARVSIHSRAKGHSAVAASSYRSGTKLIDNRTGITHDYTKRHDVVFSAVLLPEGANAAFEKREYLWNQAEACEKRKDAQVCKDIVLALPKEIDLHHQIELTRRFVQTHFIDNGLPADISIHHHHGEENPHTHILVPTRKLEKDGFSKYKARDLNPVFAKGHIVEKDYWGELWRDAQNTFFEEKNLDISVDLNHFISERHRGKNNPYLEEENQIIRKAREELVLDTNEKIIAHLSERYSVFSRRDIERLLFKSFKDTQKAETYLQRVEQILADKNIIHLGLNDKGKDCYTTKEQYIQEARLRDDIESLMLSKTHNYSNNIDTLSQNYTLSEEQHKALAYIAENPDIAVVLGRPGTGKSYLLKPVKEYYEANHCRVIGAALSGKVAKALQTDTGIPSSTIASLAYKLKNNSLQLTNKHIIIIDEAGMVDFNNMSLLITEAKKAGSKILLVGDPDQLKPIYKGEIFKGISAITGYIELENIKRQNDLGDRQASLNLAKGNIDAALHHYHGKGAVSLTSTQITAMDALIEDWQKDITTNTLKDSILLSFTRKAVAELNFLARDKLKEKNIIGNEEISFQSLDKELTISQGERLLLKQNDKFLGVRNGDLGIVKAVNKAGFDITLDSGETVHIPNTYKAIDYGYALTVHKSQGMTAEHTHVLIDSKYWDRHLSFVAMTRHKQSLKIYADTINHPSWKELKTTLSRSTTKDNVIDWPLNFAIRAGFNPDKLIEKVVNKIVGLGHKIKQSFNFIVNYEAHLLGSKSILIERDATNNHGIKSAYDALKDKYPLLAEYDAHSNKKTVTTGYFREKQDKFIQDMAKKIIKDTQLIKELKQAFPERTKQIFMQASHLSKKVHLHE